MNRKKGLVIIHIDGLSYSNLQKALRQDYMPYVKKLIDVHGYKLQKYRCGLPSTTPYVQAGILYGDNRNIPAFNWWDKKLNTGIHFGARATFRKISRRYFKNTKPLLKGGACIAGCFPGGAKKTFAMAYRESVATSKTMHSQLFFRWIRNPFHLVNWAYYNVFIFTKILIEYVRVQLFGRELSVLFLLGDLLNELFLHHLTRFATMIAMEENFQIIYSAFYAYDETAHAFGPDDPYSTRMLLQVDRTIKYIANHRIAHGKQQLDYEILLLSDHGQVPTAPMRNMDGQGIRQYLAELLPTYKIDGLIGSTQVNTNHHDGTIKVTYSGGLAHIYFIDNPNRLHFKQVEKKFPGLICSITHIKGVEGLMIKDGRKDLFITSKAIMVLSKKMDEKTMKYLSKFDDPHILSAQLRKLNSFESTGDIVLFGKYHLPQQVNFEIQAGGHGAFGGDQMFPFILGKKDWNIDTSDVTDASDVYKILTNLRDSVVNA